MPALNLSPVVKRCDVLCLTVTFKFLLLSEGTVVTSLNRFVLEMEMRVNPVYPYLDYQIVVDPLQFSIHPDQLLKNDDAPGPPGRLSEGATSGSSLNRLITKMGG